MNILSDEELETLLDSFLQQRGNRPTANMEMDIIIEWAEGVKLEYLMFENVLDGVSSIDIDSDGEITFSLTADGEVEAEDLLEDNGIEA